MYTTVVDAVNILICPLQRLRPGDTNPSFDIQSLRSGIGTASYCFRLTVCCICFPLHIDTVTLLVVAVVVAVVVDVVGVVVAVVVILVRSFIGSCSIFNLSCTLGFLQI